MCKCLEVLGLRTGLALLTAVSGRVPKDTTQGQLSGLLPMEVGTEG